MQYEIDVTMTVHLHRWVNATSTKDALVAALKFASEADLGDGENVDVDNIRVFDENGDLVFDE